MNKQDLIPLVEKVAELRKKLGDISMDQTSAMKEYMQTEQYKKYEGISNEAGILSTDLDEAEDKLKITALTLYEETKEKKPVDKVEIKIFKRLSYSLTEVLAWCKHNAPSLLIVNKKPFEKTAVEIGAPVEVTEEAKCTIGTDLSAYLKQTEEVKTDDTSN